MKASSSVEVDSTLLVLGSREYFSYNRQHTKALVANNEFHSVQTTPAEPLKEIDSAALSSFISSEAPRTL